MDEFVHILDSHLGLGVRTEPLDLALFTEVLDFFHEFVGEADQFDDLTMLSLKYLNKNKNI